MDFNEHNKLSCKLSELAWNNFYKIDLLKGYCENSMPDDISSDMLFTLLEELHNNSSQLIKQIDIYSTNVGKELVRTT